MRTLSLIKGDFRFIFKYGIVFIYVVFSVIYLFLLMLIPGKAREITSAILIYTDPAAMGLFFMGAMILLEKSQRVNCSLSVTPITIDEYIWSKIISLLVPGTIVAGILCTAVSPIRLLTCLPAVIISSSIFSLCGLICAVKTKSLNGFLIMVIPFEILICAPAIWSLFADLKSVFWLLHPGISAMRLILGDCSYWYLGVIGMLFWLSVAYFFCRKAVKKYLIEMGGGKIL